MDGENNGKPYFWMDDLGGKTLFFGCPPMYFPIEDGEFFSSQLPAMLVGLPEG